MSGEIYELKCDMKKDCTSPVTMLDNKGYIYCTSHGLRRRSSGIPCRKLTSSEIKRLKRGEPVKSHAHPNIPPNALSLMILGAVSYNSNVQDPSVQDAIDWMAAQNYMNRKQLFQFLRDLVNRTPEPERESEIGHLLREAWVDEKLLKKATGRTRTAWLNLLG